jgi:hypothetical protein
VNLVPDEEQPRGPGHHGERHQDERHGRRKGIHGKRISPKRTVQSIYVQVGKALVLHLNMYLEKRRVLIEAQNVNIQEPLHGFRA